MLLPIVKALNQLLSKIGDLFECEQLSLVGTMSKKLSAASSSSSSSGSGSLELKNSARKRMVGRRPTVAQLSGTHQSPQPGQRGSEKDLTSMDQFKVCYRAYSS